MVIYPIISFFNKFIWANKFPFINAVKTIQKKGCKKNNAVYMPIAISAR